MAKITKTAFPEKDQHSKAAEIDKYTDILVLNHNLAFGDATYKINKNRQTNFVAHIIGPKKATSSRVITPNKELNSWLTTSSNSSQHHNTVSCVILFWV